MALRDCTNHSCLQTTEGKGVCRDSEGEKGSLHIRGPFLPSMGLHCEDPALISGWQWNCSSNDFFPNTGSNLQ